MKTNFFKSVLTLAFSLIIIVSANATHLLGGEITWECSTNGNYIFTLTLYQDCNGNQILGPPETITNPAGANIVCTLFSETDISPSCWNPSDPNYPVQITCNAAINNTGPNDIPGAVKKFVFKSQPVALNGTPPATGWEFSWRDCCRPTGNQNTNSAFYYLRAKMYPYTNPQGVTLNTNNCYDSSPFFAEDGSPVICTGNKFVYNHLASDVDLDSLSFKYADPLTDANVPVAWNAGFSSAIPFPDGTEHSSNGPVTLDPVTGEVTMDVQSFGTSAGAGSYASCVKVEAWRCNQLIAEVYRDVSISMQDNCPANTAPDSEIDTSIFKYVNKLTDNSYHIQIYPGDTIDINISAQDFDFLPNGTPQTICFEAGGLEVSNVLTSSTGCLGATPCAKFNPVAPQTGFCQGLQNTINFFWAPTCAHLGFAGNGCGSLTSTYYFTLKMTDNGCPAPAVSITTLIIDVLAGDPTPPPFTSIFEQTNGDIDLLWNESEQDSALKFNYYKVFGSLNINGPYVALDSIPVIDSLNTTIPAAGGYRHFYMIKSTGECDFLSENSDTLSLITLTMNTSPPPPNSQFADLQWTALHTPLLPTSRKNYEIWAKATSGPWVFVTEVPEVPNAPSNYTYQYTDTASFCDDWVDYQIRLVDTINGHVSGSNYQNGRFSDQNNGDIMALDSATVVGDLATLSWNPTSQGDVIEYHVLFNDPVSGWTTIDVLPTGSPMPYTWANSQAGNRSEEFKVISMDSCMNLSENNVVVAHQTINLKANLNRCDGEVKLSWNYYDGFPLGTGGYDIYAKEDNGGGFGNPILLFTGTNADSNYVRTNLTANTEYCFFVRAYNADSTKSSTSNEVCIVADVPQKSRILYMASVSNNFLRGSIDLVTFVDGEADVRGYDIERSTEENGVYQVIGTVDKPVSLPYIVNFSDYSADPERIYYYRLKSQNLCGGVEGISNICNNVVLDAKPNANLTNKLSWVPFEEWGGGVGRYDIYRSINDESNYQLVGSTAGDITFYYDDIQTFGDQSGKFFYYVQAVEDNNPLGLVDVNGQPFSAISNRVALNQRAKVFVPTAFRPTSDIEANRTFGPSMRFEEVEEYDFYILNRWGSIVFKTSDPSEFWDGHIDGQPAPLGVYVYYLKYSTINDSAQEEKGTFSLVN